jgi:membrane-bound lytic murein transglycosylase B
MMKWRMTRYTVLLMLLCSPALTLLSAATSPDFSAWMQELRKEAMSKGISEETLDRTLAGVEPDSKIIKLDRNQPEFKQTFEQYLNKTVTWSRILKGRRLLLEHRDLLDQTRSVYGVQPRFLVAIWAMETNFGSYMGSRPIIQSLVTLAYDKRRSAFFRKELFHALTILDEGHIDVTHMKGSWAGAMGQVQFMPSSFISYAVDADKDGRKDIWNSLPDVFASAANYLSGYNWNGNWTCGREVRLPLDFDQSLAGMNTKKILSEWQQLGVRRIIGTDLPEANISASLIMPGGSNGPAFLVYKNYRSLYRWNRSHLYALAVCRLSDKLK